MMERDAVGMLQSSVWLVRVRSVLTFAVICGAFVGLGWYQPNVADAETLMVGPSQNIATSPVNATAAYVVMSRITVTSSGAGDGKIELNSLTLDDNGASTVNYAAARVYLSSTPATTIPADAVQIGRTVGTWNGASMAIPLSSGTTTQRSIFTGTPKYLYIVYDMLSTEASRTAQSRVTAIGTVADGNITGLNYTSNALLLSSGGAKATVVNCFDCHGDGASSTGMDGARSATTGSFIGSHNKHIGSLSYQCTYCHVDAASTYTNGHRNSTIDMSTNGYYKPGTGKVVGGSYSKPVSFPQTTNPLPMGTCNTIYCHSNGASSYSAPTWGSGSLSATCTGCHGGNSTSGAVMGSEHPSHINSVGNTGRSIACGECHSATVGSGTLNDRNLTGSNHLSGQLNIKFDPAGVNYNADNPTYNGLSTTVANGATVTGGNYYSCNNVYCHSIGNLSSTTLLVPVAGFATFKTPTWNTTTIGCAGCHGDGGSKSHPVYVGTTAGSTTANSHVKHVESSGLGCNYCHVATVGTTTLTATPTSLPSTTYHLNRVENVTFMVNGGLTGVYNAAVGQKTCSATYCHGTAASIGWGGTTTCASCHDASNALSTAQTNSNRHWIHYETSTAATTIVTGNSATAGSYVFGCGNCHDRNQINHATGTNDVKFNVVLGGVTPTTGTYTAGGSLLTDTRGYSYSQNGTCSNIYCHSNGQPIGGVAYSTKTVTWNQSLGVAPNDCSVCHGGRADSTTPIATNRHTTHINSTQYNYSCAECHYATTTTGTSITNKVNHVDGTKDVAWKTGGTNSGAGAYASPNCTTTYCHSNGTIGAAPYAASRVTASWTGGLLDCAGCHGNTAATLTTGAHEKHLAASTWLAGQISCEDCHSATATNNTTLNSYTNHVNKLVTMNLNTFSSGPTATYNGQPVGQATYQKPVNTAKGTCNTTYCHGGNSLAWDDVTRTNDATCVKCHGVSGATAANYSADPDIAAPGYVSTAPAGTGVDTSGNGGTVNGVSPAAKVGAHDGHLRGVGGYKPGGIACSECHNVVSLASTSHMNGQTTFSWSNMAQNVPPGTSGYYSTTLTPTYNPLTGSCATNYCHGGAFGAGVIGTDPTPTWTDGTYLANPASALISTDCNKCHLSPPTSIAKYDHTGISVGAGNCSACHGHDGAGATHIDGTLYGAGTCDSCHSYDLDTTGDWGMSPKAIEGWGAHAVHISHLKTVSGVTLSAKVDTFGGAVYTQVCGVCHTTNTANHVMSGGTATRQINFSDGSPTYQFSVSSGTPTYAGVSGVSSATAKKTCSNISCHFQTTPVWQGY